MAELTSFSNSTPFQPHAVMAPWFRLHKITVGHRADHRSLRQTSAIVYNCSHLCRTTRKYNNPFTVRLCHFHLWMQTLREIPLEMPWPCPTCWLVTGFPVSIFGNKQHMKTKFRQIVKEWHVFICCMQMLSTNKL